MGYGEYLDPDNLLSAQHLRSDNHNEPLFIIIHHVTELWLKLALHELTAARECIRQDNLMPSFKMTARVSRIFEQMANAWGVLATLTPSGYLQFRGTPGVPYLRKMLDVVLFPELWKIRTAL